MGIVKEFKEFIMRGNVMDMAVGVIIGGAFGTVITSLVEDVITPIIGMIGGNPDFSSLAIGAKEVVNEAGEKVLEGGIMYGKFINAVISFLIIGLCLFLILKAFNKASSMVKKPEEAAEPDTKECPYCKSQIAKAATRCPNCTSQL